MSTRTVTATTDAPTGSGAAPMQTTVTQSQPTATGRGLLLSLGGIVLTVVATHVIAVLLPPQGYAGLVGVLFLLSMILPALIAFFGIYFIRNEMRDAITAGFVVSYLLMLLSAVTLPFGVFETGTTGSLRSALLNNFTGLMQVVIVFYFGSEAAVQIADKIFVGRVAAANATAAAGAASGHAGEVPAGDLAPAPGTTVVRTEVRPT